MSLRHALLGLLVQQPASGYELTREFDRALQRYAWHARHSQIYPELNRLAADGLISEIDQGARGRRSYAITPAGRTELRRWLLDPPDAFAVRNEFVLRLFLVSTLDPGDARALLTSITQESAREIAALQESIEKADATAGSETALPFGRLVAEYGLRSYRTLHEWAAWATDRLEQPD